MNAIAQISTCLGLLIFVIMLILIHVTASKSKEVQEMDDLPRSVMESLAAMGATSVIALFGWMVWTYVRHKW